MSLEQNITAGQSDRRSFIKLMAAAPLFATIGSRSLANTVAAATKMPVKGNIYSRLGVRSFINARGTWTYLSGSLELPEVRKATEEASHHFVDMFELQVAAGRYLAKLSGAESGMVTSGSAGAIAVATAGCIAGCDPKNVWQLPDTTGLKGEVVMLGGRSAFDNAIRLCGAKLVIVPTVDSLNSYPTLTVQWDEQKFGLTIDQCAEQLRAGEPRIEVLTNNNPSLVPAVSGREPRSKVNHLQIISMTLQDGEDLIVGNSLRRILNKARKESA
jgi:hypothetical protein